MARFTSTTRNTSRNRRRIGDRTAADRPSRRAGIDGGAVIACSPPSSRFGWQPTASAGVLIWLPAPTRLPPGSRARHQNMPGCGRPITDQTKGVTDVAEKSNAGKASAGASDSAASGPGHSDESFQREITTRMQSFFEAARLQPIFDAQQRMLTDVVSRLQPGEVLSRIQSVFEAQQRAVAEAANRLQTSDFTHRLQSVFAEQQKAVEGAVERLQSSVQSTVEGHEAARRLQSAFEDQQHAVLDVVGRLQSAFEEQQKAVTEAARRFQATLTGHGHDSP